MGFMEFFRGNDGFDKQAVPGKDTTPSGEEANALERQRLEKENIENQIVALEQETGGDSNHPKYQELENLRNQFAEILPQR